MRRNFSTFVLASLLALVASAPSVHYAHAAGGACGNWTDTPGVVYDNGDYRVATGPSYWDNYAGAYAHLKMDMKSYRLTGNNQYGFDVPGQCYRYIQWTEWTSNGDYGNLYMHVLAYSKNFGLCNQNTEDFWTTGTWTWNIRQDSGWLLYSGCGGPAGGGYAFGTNPDWNGFYPNSVPYANVTF